MQVTIGWVRQRMVFSRRGSRVKDPKSLVAIARGAYFNPEGIPAGTAPWHLRKVVTLARMLYLEAYFSPRADVAFTGEAAGVALGFDTWWTNPDIAYRAAVRRKRKRRLPAVVIRGTVVPSVAAYHVTGGLKSRRGDHMEADGLRFVPHAAIIADTARREHPLQAYVFACSVLQKLCGFSRFRQSQTRLRAAKIRRAWLAEAERIRGRRAYRVLQAIINAADPGADTPIESAALWAIKCLLGPTKGAQVVTQEPVKTRFGDYYLDIALPGLKAAIETDGAVKYGLDEAAYRHQAARHTNRHQDITRSGWNMTHIQAGELNSVQLLRRTSSHMRSSGMCGGSRKLWPRGHLYRPLADHLFGRARRF